MAMDTTMKTATARTSGQFSTFYVADLFFGVDVLHVQEVLRSQHMTPVPQSPEVIEGLINLRGQIVTAIDMRRKLGLSRRDGDQAPMNVLVRTLDGAVSLLVDEIGDVLDMDSGTYEKPPENLDPAVRELICGVYKLSDRLLLILDTEKAVEVDSSQSVRNVKPAGRYSEETPAPRPGASPASEGVMAEPREPSQSQKPAKKGSKKAAAKKS